jgi:hypothetical protein
MNIDKIKMMKIIFKFFFDHSGFNWISGSILEGELVAEIKLQHLLFTRNWEGELFFNSPIF